MPQLPMRRYLTRFRRSVDRVVKGTPPPIQSFHDDSYLRLNNRRLEHLASLGLDLTSKTVLEVGAGIGDHTHFFLDRECRVTATDGRPGNAQILAARYPKINVRLLDLNTPDSSIEGRFDIVYCYGLLYHLDQPAAAIEYMSSRCKDMLLLETCVSYGNESLVNLCDEDASAASQSITGVGCRPTRRWLHEELGKQFAHVYMPNTQPFHAEFPIDWTAADESTTKLIRSVFVASRRPLDNPLLFEGIPMQQSR